MLQAFKDHLSHNFSFLSTKKILVACSGGLDSIVLSKLCVIANIDISIAHCNFKLRAKDSDADETFVANFAKYLKVPFYSTHFDTNEYASSKGVSTQMAARELRYDWFRNLSEEHGFAYVLTAHHADDNLETVLINLLRGTGIDGLTGIPEVNTIYCRPLLPFSRIDIQDFAEASQIEWREDVSNASTKYLRNKLRHDVVPVLKTTTPELLKTVATTIQNLKQSRAFISSQVSFLQSELFIKNTTNEISISLDRLRTYGDPKIYLYFLLKDYGFTAWDDINQMISAQSGKQVFSTTHRLVKDRACLLLSKISKDRLESRYSVSKAQTCIELDEFNVEFEEVQKRNPSDLSTIYVDKEKLNYPLVVRKWKEGDYFYPLGLKGKKKLSKFFKDEKLSLLAKERVWLLCSNDEIVWVLNYRTDERFKVEPLTKTILKITIN